MYESTTRNAVLFVASTFKPLRPLSNEPKLSPFTTGFFFQEMKGISKYGTPYILSNKRTILEHIDESMQVPLRTMMQESKEDCRQSGKASTVEFVIDPDVVQCPYDNGFRQHVRVMDEIFVANTVS